MFDLSAAQEVPPNSRTSTGGCFGQLDQPSAQFAITCVHNVIGATVMHIHRGAPGVNGPVAFDLGSPTSPVSATWSGMTPADISDLVAGNLYVNIHSAGRPNGEIRGQILPRTVDVVNFTANGAQAVPPSATAATATCSADLDNAATSLAIQCTHNLAGATDATVNEAPAGQNGPAVFTFPSAASPLSANVPMTPRLVADFAATFLYLDIHTPLAGNDTPADEIRGQIGTPPPPPTTGTIRIVKNTTPAGGSGFGFTDNVPGGPSTFTLNDGATQTFSGVDAGTYTITENAASGSTLTDVVCSDDDSVGNSFARTATVALQGGETVTCTFRNLQTFTAPSTFVFDLSGAQEAPPTSSTSRGGCMAEFDSATSALSIVCVHNVVGATLMHIHRGAPGVNGPVAFDLGTPISPVSATWSGMTPADVADLFAGNFYVNIHSAGRPTGEIRGQILPRTVDVVNFTANGAQVVPPNSTTATATCSADLDNAAASLAIQCTHNLAGATEATVNEAPAGQNGPVAFTFPSAASPLLANMPMTPRLVADFAATFLYLDIHTPPPANDTPADEIRGQIGAPPPAPTTGTIRIVKNTTPAGGTGFSFTDDIPGGPAAFTLNDAAVQTFSNVAAGTYTITENAASGSTLTDVVCSGGNSAGNAFARTATVSLQGGQTVTCTFRNLKTFTAPATFVFDLSGAHEAPPTSSPSRGGCMAEFDGTSTLSIVCVHNVVGATVMHIHRGAAGVNGPVAFDLGSPTSPVSATWSGMTPADVADLLAGNLYVNIHTGGRPTGEIRGQIVPRSIDNFSFPLDGSQEVPPTNSAATGTCHADLSDDAATLAVQCSHNVNAPTDAHLHVAPPGEEGPVVFRFPATNSFTSSVPMSPRLDAEFAAGFLYVNVHTQDFPDGEIRGQALPGAAAVTPVPALSWWLALFLTFAVAAIGWWRLRG